MHNWDSFKWESTTCKGLIQLLPELLVDYMGLQSGKQSLHQDRVWQYILYHLQPLQKEARIQWTESPKLLLTSHPQSVGVTIHFHTTYNLCRKKQGSSEQKVPNCCCHLIHKVWVWQYTFILLAAFAERSKDPVNRKSQIADVISSTKWILKMSVTDKLPQITDFANASI